MSKVFIEESTLTAIGNSIRSKTGKTELINPTNMPAEIESIQSGSGIPAEGFILTGNCSDRFANNGWNWFINMYGDITKTQDITDSYYMFGNSSELQSIPFDINFKQSNNTGINMVEMFSECYKLSELPKINYAKPSSITSLFSGCESIRYIPDNFDSNWDWSRMDSGKGSMNDVFDSCRSLRKLPMNMLKHGGTVIYNKSWYNWMCYYCHSLDEIVGLPIPHSAATWVSNAFIHSFSSCSRLKEMTFALQENGTPYVVKWTSQTIDLSDYVGYATNVFDVVGYNNGITEDKKVSDNATYQALKNDPDWFGVGVNYSRYNHTSAVNTINSLPDTSAYLTANGGTNTIKFKGAAGALTDGGAINTLTEEEIAVAVSKGWTVSLV